MENAAALMRWFNKNRQELIPYRSQYVAYTADGIIAAGHNLQNVLEQARKREEPFAVYFVPRYTASMQLVPVRLRSVSRHAWLPTYPVYLKHGTTELPATMLVDSGADFSVISRQIGEDLGYALADAEQTLLAQGIGGTVSYVLRSMEMNIDGHTFVAPVAWLQDEGEAEEMILGREVVFDRFNIEFRQADEQILFRWRGEP